MISLDTETSGLDLYHGASPFFVTIGNIDGSQSWVEWQVDPVTRQIQTLPDDIKDILDLLRSSDRIVTHHGKFDCAALATLSPSFSQEWPWDQTEDTLIASHLLASNQPHDLTSLTLQYLGIDIQPYENALEEAVQHCRRQVQQARLRGKRGTAAKVVKGGRGKELKALLVAAHNSGGATDAAALHDWLEENGVTSEEAAELSEQTLRDAELASWRIADRDLPEMPSAKEKTWKFDTWLPRAWVKWQWMASEAYQAYFTGQDEDDRNDLDASVTAEGLGGWDYRPPGITMDAHPYWTVLAEYANTDSAVTLALWRVMEKELRRRNLWAIYRERMRLPAIAHRMERRGLTYIAAHATQLREEYTEESTRLGRVCVNIAAGKGYALELPKNGLNASLRTCCFDVLHLPRYYSAKAKTSNPTLDKNAIERYENELPPGSLGLMFIKSLKGKRVRDTALAFLDAYERFCRPWIPAGPGAVDSVTGTGWYVLHPSLNITGTDTLRWSSSNPNEQQISKKEGFNLRYAFGPAPGREWWSCDAKNLELRIPAYESGEKDLIDLFERADEPPFYGSEHLLNFSIVYPDIWADAVAKVGLDKAGPWCKKTYASTWYQRCKNGDFAVGYGAVDKADGTGTADRTFGRPGSHARLKARFAQKEALNQKWIKYAEKFGYVETLPDRTVDPARGYPLLCSRTENGRIKPTVPLNYHIQGTAMWWTARCMVECQKQLDAWNARGFDGYLALQVHDEIVFDLPRRGDPVAEAKRGDSKWRTSNLWRVRALQKIMANCGEDIGIPITVGTEYHNNNWAEGVTL